MKRVYLFIIASVFLCSYNYSQSGYVSFDNVVNGYDSIRTKEGTIKLKGDVFESDDFTYLNSNGDGVFYAQNKNKVGTFSGCFSAGKETIPCIYEDGKRLDYGWGDFFAAKLNGKWGLLNPSNGEIIEKFKYDSYNDIPYQFR